MDRASSPRKPWLAVVLSLLCTGLGHVYAGAWRRGLLFLGLSLLQVPAIALLSRLDPAAWVLHAMLALTLALFLLYVVAAVDAFFVARRGRVHYTLRTCNHMLVYVLLLVFQFVYPLTSVLVLRAHFLRAFVIPTRSMAPTLVPRDRVLVRLGALRDGLPERGDVVVFLWTNEEGRPVHYVKRVIGLPGERVQVAGGVVWLNGRRITEAVPSSEGTEAEVVVGEAVDGRRWQVLECSQDAEEARHGEGVLVPDGHLFLLGDRRSLSRESRHFGPIPLAAVLGPASYVLSRREGGPLLGLVE